MKNEKVIILPDEEEMFKCLLKVENSSAFKKWFCPLLIKQAGKEKTAKEVALILLSAKHDFVELLLIKDEMPLTSTLMSIHMHVMLLPRLVDTLVDDQEVAQQAKDFLEEN